jgi:aryl-alcohol dehydrogenase-like predicted oxidoreductase
MMGKCLKELERSSYVLATKLWAPMGPGPNDRGLSAKHVRHACEASLKRLGLDFIDLYQCHRPDPETPLDETIRAMEDLARQGKVIYWGVSEWPAGLMAEAQGVARSIGCRPMTSNQPRYNLLYRDPEVEVIPQCEREGIGLVNFSPLAHGVLTGKYAPRQPPRKGTRASDPERNQVMMKLYWQEEKLKKAQAMRTVAQEAGLKPSQLALAWCLRRPIVASSIIGATSVAQIEENLKAAEVTLSEDLLKKLDELFPPPVKLGP